VQKNPMHIQGSRLGAANSDIDHIVHIVDHRQRFDVLVNVLLAHDGAKTLIFARTRADVARLAAELFDIGFKTTSLSGEMEQRERNRALQAFTRGECRILVATDVAARGLDVQDVTLVVHFDPPTDPDDYTHRSGRTGRAGRKGKSILLVAPREVPSAKRILSRARITAHKENLPSPEAIRRDRSAQFLARLTAEDETEVLAPHVLELAEQLAARSDVGRTLARLIGSSNALTGPEPREVEPLERAAPRAERAPQKQPRAESATKPRTDRPWSIFHVTWGARHGADPGRLLAMVCRRGRVERHEVGGIRIGPHGSEVEIAIEAAERFAESARRRDPRDPHVVIRHESQHA
jgi:ATP-dependent RNA helicase DeaD